MVLSHKCRTLEAYCVALEGSMCAKCAAVSPWVMGRYGASIIDIGTGTAGVAAWLASRLPHCSVIGIDASLSMLKAARRRHTSAGNPIFVRQCPEQLALTEATPIILSSVLHEIYSYHGFSLQPVKHVLRQIWEHLEPGGRVIIRDFIAPNDSARPVLLRHSRKDIVTGHDFQSFLHQFPRPISLDGVESDSLGITYTTDRYPAYEYIYRKDYHTMWSLDLQEQYGFWTIETARTLLRRAGFTVVHQRVDNGLWNRANSLAGNIELLDPTDYSLLSYPPYQIFLVGEKLCQVFC